MRYSMTAPLAALCLCASLVSAVPPAADSRPRIGAPAPALNAARWINGAPAATFEPGRVYIVEFWATFCAPCIEAMPHLRELQERYKDSVTAIAVDVQEKSHGRDLKFVERFIRKQGTNLRGFLIALDDPDTGAIYNAWNEIVDVGLPSAFIVDRAGKLAWAGQPRELDNVMPRVLDGSFDAAAEKAKQDEIRIAQIVDWAVGMAAQARDYSLTSQTYSAVSDLDGREKSYSRGSTRITFQSPGRLWMDDLSSGQEWTIVMADGQRLFEYQDGGIRESPVLKEDYVPVGERRFDALSPLFMIAKSMDDDLKRARLKIHRGTETVRGDVCSVVEFGIEIEQDLWRKARAAQPRLPEKGIMWNTYYIGTESGRVLRQVAKAPIEFPAKWYTLEELNAAPPAVYNSTIYRETNYIFGALHPEPWFTKQYFDAAVTGALGDKEFPAVQQAAADSPWVGQTLPALGMETIDGKPFRFEDYKGMVVVVETWATWCGYCIYAMPYYEKMRAKLKDRGVVFVAVDLDKDKAAYEKWVRKNGGEYGFVWVRPPDVPGANKAWNIQGDPTFFILGTDGKVAASYVGFGYGEGGEDPRLDAALRELGVKL